ncbi:hypothetical protein DFH28DRAFT_1078707 [Melampsora americana]|nr:hypothetical protein DFH28DRAFT_1078707 [Melampsora americana]
MKLRGAPRILHKIQKLTDKVTKRLRGHDDFKRELMETKPMQSVVPRLIVPQLSAHTEDGTPRTGSESTPDSHFEENLANENCRLASIESSPLNGLSIECSTSKTGPALIVAIANECSSSPDQALSMKKDVPSKTEEFERASSAVSLVSVRKRPYDEADALGWVVDPDPVIKRAKYSNVHNYAPLLRLMKDLYLNVRDMICDEVPGVDRVTSIEIKYASVLSEMRSMFSQVDHHFQELLLCEKDAVMYEAGHI